MTHFLLSFLSILFMPLISIAYTPKEGNLNVLLAPFFYKTYFKDTANAIKSPWRGDAAFVLNGDISDRGALEIGIFRLNKNYFREQSSLYVAEATELLHITMGYRRWIIPDLSWSVAISSGYSMGEVKIVHNDFPYGSKPDTSATDTTEYGLELSAQYELLSWPQSSMVLDTRYSLSVTAKPNEKADHWGVLLGYRFFIQGKQVVKR